jgi:hypothetical protein
MRSSAARLNPSETNSSFFLRQKANRNSDQTGIDLDSNRKRRIATKAKRREGSVEFRVNGYVADFRHRLKLELYTPFLADGEQRIRQRF